MGVLAATLVAALAMPASALAQDPDQTRQAPPRTQKPPPKPAAPKVPVGLRLAFVVDVTAMSAADTFKALTGSPWMAGVGGEADVLNLWRKMYLRVGFASASKNGEHVNVADGIAPVPNGVPITIGVKSFELAAGWRRALKKHPQREWYVGGGYLITPYSETSDLAEGAENDSGTFGGFVAHAGFEFALTKKRQWIAGVEGQYRHVPDAFGGGGVSAALGETNLGGATIRGLVGYRLRR